MTATREAAASPSVHGSDGLRLVGADVEVPLVTGGTRRYVNLDYAASAPALEAVHDAVEGVVVHAVHDVAEQPPYRGLRRVQLALHRRAVMPGWSTSQPSIFISEAFSGFTLETRKTSSRRPAMTSPTSRSERPSP